MCTFLDDYIEEHKRFLDVIVILTTGALYAACDWKDAAGAALEAGAAQPPAIPPVNFFSPGAFH